MTTFEVVVVWETCGETFELVGFTVRVRFTCGQDFARTAGSGFKSEIYSFEFCNLLPLTTKIHMSNLFSVYRSSVNEVGPPPTMVGGTNFIY